MDHSLREEIRLIDSSRYHNDFAKKGRNTQITHGYEIKVNMETLNTTFEIGGNGIMQSRSRQLKTL